MSYYRNLSPNRMTATRARIIDEDHRQAADTLREFVKLGNQAENLKNKWENLNKEADPDTRQLAKEWQRDLIYKEKDLFSTLKAYNVDFSSQLAQITEYEAYQVIEKIGDQIDWELAKVEGRYCAEKALELIIEQIKENKIPLIKTFYLLSLLPNSMIVKKHPKQTERKYFTAAVPTGLLAAKLGAGIEYNEWTNLEEVEDNSSNYLLLGSMLGTRYVKASGLGTGKEKIPWLTLNVNKVNAITYRYMKIPKKKEMEELKTNVLKFMKPSRSVDALTSVANKHIENTQKVYENVPYYEQLLSTDSRLVAIMLGFWLGAKSSAKNQILNPFTWSNEPLIKTGASVEQTLRSKAPARHSSDWII